MDDEVFLERLGQKILGLRIKKGIGQRELAELIQSTNMQIRRIERGEVNSSINMLRKIAKELGISVSKLVDI